MAYFSLLKPIVIIPDINPKTEPKAMSFKTFIPIAKCPSKIENIRNDKTE